MSEWKYSQLCGINGARMLAVLWPFSEEMEPSLGLNLGTGALRPFRVAGWLLDGSGAAF